MTSTKKIEDKLPNINSMKAIDDSELLIDNIFLKIK